MASPAASLVGLIGDTLPLVGGTSTKLSFFASAATFFGGFFSLLAVSLPKPRRLCAKLSCYGPRCFGLVSHQGSGLGPLLGGLPEGGGQLPVQTRPFELL